MNVNKKVHGMKFDGKILSQTDITIRITADKYGKTLTLSTENPLNGVMLSIPLEAIEKELKKVLK